ncbi:unnamed protein product, partial [Rotaria socialis]
MLFGAWLASIKPPRDSLLIPIIIQLQALMNSKILLKQKDGKIVFYQYYLKNGILGSRVSYNVRIQQAIFDLPACAHFLNVVQYNGYDGCDDCCIKAIGRQIYFPFSEKTEEPKNYQLYLKNSKHNAHRSIQGIKGPTPLSSILQLPNQTPYDLMHLIYHVHVKALLKFWRKMFGKEIFENGSVFLSNVILPHDVKYQFHSLLDFSNWKAKMLRDFFLYVSPSFVVYYLPDDYSAHFLLYYAFVRTLYFFNDNKQLDGVDHLFHLYHKSLSRLYSERSELATVHYHSHLASQVHSHDALCFTSCFSRESYLAYALKLCKGTTHVLNQLVT